MDASFFTPVTCWVVSDGKLGIDNQCIGLAEALGLSWQVKHISLRSPWRLAFPIVPVLHAHAFRPGDALDEPWPDVLITGGRSGAAVSLFVKHASLGHTITIHIQNPHLNPKRFDLVLVGVHDRLKGKNVIALDGALNRVTPEKLSDAKAAFQNLGHLPRPRIAVLIGGANRCYCFGKPEAEKLATQLAVLAKSGHSLMVTASRRTGAENLAILKQAVPEHGHFFWDDTGDNPIFAILGYADAIIVTCDSISMISEAATTGKPVYVVDLPGGDSKFRAFHRHLAAKRITRPFTGDLRSFTYTKLDDTKKAAAVVNLLFQSKSSS